LLKQISYRLRYSLSATIPGIGAKIATVLAAEIGDIKRFQNYKQLVAYCGIDPRVFQSGNFTATKNKLTRRGSPFLRRGLYLAATVAIRKDSKGNMVNPVIYEYYQNKIQSKARKQALGAIMNKLTRIIFSVLKHQKAFELPVVEDTTNVSNIVEMKIA
jgi:transposase